MVNVASSSEIFCSTFDSQHRRKTVTGSRDALNDYQKGKCFYCFSNLQLNGIDCPDVDHFFPHILKPHNLEPAIDAVCNLALAYRKCNRGEKGKSDRIPTLRLLAATQDPCSRLPWLDPTGFCQLPGQSYRRTDARFLAGPKLTADLWRKSCDDIKHGLLRRTFQQRSEK